MRARTKCSSFIPIEVKESNPINSEVFCSRSNNSIRFRIFKSFLCIQSFTNYKCIIDSCCVVSVIIGQTELNSSKSVVSNFKVMESDITNFLSYGSISSIFPAGEPIKVSSYRWILPPRISLIIVIIYNWFAWICSRNHIMENTKTIPSA